MPPPPPGPMLQAINAALHREPLATIAHVVVFLCFLTFGFPVAVVGLLLYGMARIIMGQLPPIVPHQNLGVVITGCDTGFGRELALASADAGYTVFAGCLDPEKAWPGALPSRLIPVQMDVTKEAQVNSAVRRVEEWLAEGDSHTLYALVNNAGVGRMGLIDWLDMESFEHCMKVNYFGLVRSCKCFLPIFKRQADTKCRIINLTSMAGRAYGYQTGAAYMASKHAANAFSHVLRAECRLYVQVSTVCPTFHATALVNNLEKESRAAWDGLPAHTRDEYGEGYFQSLSQYCYERPYRLAWNIDVVVEKLETLLQSKILPPEVCVGSDARFVFAPMLTLPIWCSEQLMRIGMIGLRNPAFLTSKGTTSVDARKTE